MLVSVLIVESGLRLATRLAEYVRNYSSITHARALANGLALTAPLLSCCCSSWWEYVCTWATCSVPCGALVFAVAHVPAVGWPFQLQPITVRRASVLYGSSMAMAMAIGPCNASAHLSARLHALVFLLAVRLIFTLIRSGMLMPALLISRISSPIMPNDRRLAALAPGESCRMLFGRQSLTVTRLLLQGLEAVVVTHPVAPRKFIVVFHGNGEFIDCGIDQKLALAARVGCSVMAYNYRDVGGSSGLLLSASEMVADGVKCVQYCEGQLAGADPTRCILLLGQSMGGGVATELAARFYPLLPCVNERSFSSLADAACVVLGLAQAKGRAARLLRSAVTLALGLGFNMPRPWQPPLCSADHWSAMRAGRKLLLFHHTDQVIGSAGLVYELQARGALEGTDVIELRGHTSDPHNDDPARFSPTEWDAAVSWMRGQLQLDKVE